MSIFPAQGRTCGVLARGRQWQAVPSGLKALGFLRNRRDVKRPTVEISIQYTNLSLIAYNII